MIPWDACSHESNLFLYISAELCDPLMTCTYEIFSTKCSARGAIFFEAFFDLCLRSNTRMICSWDPEGCISFHPMVSSHNILDSESKSMSQMKISCDIGWRDRDIVCFSCSRISRSSYIFFFPEILGMFFSNFWIILFRKIGHSWVKWGFIIEWFFLRARYLRELRYFFRVNDVNLSIGNIADLWIISIIWKRFAHREWDMLFSEKVHSPCTKSYCRKTSPKKERVCHKKTQSSPTAWPPQMRKDTFETCSQYRYFSCFANFSSLFFLVSLSGRAEKLGISFISLVIVLSRPDLFLRVWVYREAGNSVLCNIHRTLLHLRSYFFHDQILVPFQWFMVLR